MFGYIVVNQPELKMKEYDEYRKYYCGLCKSLKDRYGARGQISLSFRAAEGASHTRHQSILMYRMSTQTMLLT